MHDHGHEAAASGDAGAAGGARPLDPAVLARLAGDLESLAFARRVAARYRALLAGRVSRLSAALEGDDPDETLDAVLSLKASSATVGAAELTALATEVERAVRRTDLGAALAASLQLPPAAARADLALAAYLAGQPA